MKIFRLAGILTLLAIIFVGCNNDELLKSSHVREGLPAQITIRLHLPTSKKMDQTRAPESAESQIKNLLLIMFSEGGRKEIIPLHDYKLVETSSNENGGRDYTIEGVVTTKTGIYDAFIIANYNNTFSKFTEAEAESLNKAEDLEKLILQMDDTDANDNEIGYGANRLNISDDNFVPMSGRATITIDESQNNTPQVINFQVQRVMSRIEFEIAYEDNNIETVEFTPLTYQVFNLPKKAPYFQHPEIESDGTVTLTNQDLDKLMGADYHPGDDDYFQMTEEQTITNSGFSFLMFENPQGNVLKEDNSTPIDYWERDMWDGTKHADIEVKDKDGYITAIEYWKKDWTHAPKYSTFVVIKGNIVVVPKNNVTGTNAYSGTIYITVHLGNFNSKNTTHPGNTGNFDVNRNELHKYKVTVKGINSFKKEIGLDVNVDVEDGTELRENPSVEGTVTQSTNLFFLDAHYEKVMLEFSEGDLKTIIDNNQEGSEKENVVTVSSPATGFVYKDYPLSEILNAHDDQDYVIDTHWIQFMKPSGEKIVEMVNGEKITTYAFPKFIGWQMDENGEYILGSNGHRMFRTDNTYVYSGEPMVAGYLSQFLADPKTYCYYDETTKKYYTAIFIDEYAYNAEQAAVSRQYKLSEYVNTPNRVIIVNRSPRIASPDNQNAVHEYTLFEIQQRSIKTTMDITIADQMGGAYDDIFGIETWDETGCYNTTWTGPGRTANATSRAYWALENIDDNTPGVPPYVGHEDPNVTTKLTPDRGRYNTMLLHKYSDENKLRVADPYYFKRLGYLVPPTNNSAEAHTWSQRTLSPMRKNAMTAVLSRNRDLNGNGMLDDFEIRWYLPAIEQYETIWFGQQGLMQDTRLFEPNDFFYKGTYITNMNNYPKFYTSSGKDNLVYWADQGAAVTTGGQFWTAEWFGSKRHYVRACRNIPNYMVHAKFPASNYTYTNYEQTGVKGVIVVDGITNVRNYRQETYYDFHTERSESNYLPKAFEVSINIAGEEFDVKNKAADAVSNTEHTGAEALKEHYEKVLQSSILKGQKGWRIPNQREAMLLRHFNYYEKATYVTCTWFTENNITGGGTTADGRTNRFYPFTIQESGGAIVMALDAGANALKTSNYIFVRDYDLKENETPKNPNNSESYDYDGIGFGVE